MPYIDLDAQLTSITETKHDPVTIRLGGKDHLLHQPGALAYMRMAALIEALKNNEATSLDLREAADLLPRLIPTAREYLEGVEDLDTFNVILVAVVGAIEAPRIPVGVDAGEGSSVSAAASPAPSASTPTPTEQIPNDSSPTFLQAVETPER